MIALVWVLAVGVGVLAGTIYRLGDKHWFSYIAGAVGYTSIYFGFWHYVLDTYKWLPTFMTMQGTSVFELLFVASLVPMLFAFWFAHK